MAPFTITFIAFAQSSFDGGGGGGEKLFSAKHSDETIFNIININKVFVR